MLKQLRCKLLIRGLFSLLVVCKSVSVDTVCVCVRVRACACLCCVGVCVGVCVCLCVCRVCGPQENGLRYKCFFTLRGITRDIICKNLTQIRLQIPRWRTKWRPCKAMAVFQTFILIETSFLVFTSLCRILLAMRHIAFRRF